MELGDIAYIKSVLQLEFEKGRVLLACKGTPGREVPRWVWEGVTPYHKGGLGGSPPRKF